MVPQVELFSFVFRKNWRQLKGISKFIDLYQLRGKHLEKNLKNLNKETHNSTS